MVAANELPNNLTGTWLVKMEGSDSLEGFLKALDVGYLSRKIVMGVLVTTVIEHSATHFAVTETSKLGTNTTTVQPDGVARKVVNSEGVTSSITTTMDPATSAVEMACVLPTHTIMDMRVMVNRTLHKQVTKVVKQGEVVNTMTRFFYRSESPVEAKVHAAAWAKLHAAKDLTGGALGESAAEISPTPTAAPMPRNDSAAIKEETVQQQQPLPVISGAGIDIVNGTVIGPHTAASSSESTLMNAELQKGWSPHAFESQFDDEVNLVWLRNLREHMFEKELEENYSQVSDLRAPPYKRGASLQAYLLEEGLEIGDPLLDEHPSMQLLAGMHGKIEEAQLPAALDNNPPWADMASVRRGQKLFRRNIFAMHMSLMSILVNGYIVNRFSDILMIAGYADSERKTFVRFRETALHIRAWMYHDMADPHSPGRRSVKQVRCLHAFARRMALRRVWPEEQIKLQASLEREKQQTAGSDKGFASPVRVDENGEPLVKSPLPPPLPVKSPRSPQAAKLLKKERREQIGNASTKAQKVAAAESPQPIGKEQPAAVIVEERREPWKVSLGVPLSQYDIASVLTGFSVVALHAVHLGMHQQPLTEAEFEDFVHMWRFIGWHLGLEDRFNVCCSLQVAVASRNEFYATLLLWQRHLRPSTATLVRATLGGLGTYTGMGVSMMTGLLAMLCESRSFLQLDILGLPEYPDFCPVFWTFYFKCLGNPVFGRLVNGWIVLVSRRIDANRSLHYWCDKVEEHVLGSISLVSQPLVLALGRFGSKRSLAALILLFCVWLRKRGGPLLYALRFKRQ